jgi:hypothetical protein
MNDKNKNKDGPKCGFYLNYSGKERIDCSLNIKMQFSQGDWTYLTDSRWHLLHLRTKKLKILHLRFYLMKQINNYIWATFCSFRG